MSNTVTKTSLVSKLENGLVINNQLAPEIEEKILSIARGLNPMTSYTETYIPTTRPLWERSNS